MNSYKVMVAQAKKRSGSRPASNASQLSSSASVGALKLAGGALLRENKNGGSGTNSRSMSKTYTAGFLAGAKSMQNLAASGMGLSAANAKLLAEIGAASAPPVLDAPKTKKKEQPPRPRGRDKVGRLLGPADDHAKHNPISREASPEPCPAEGAPSKSVEEWCTCGLHKSPKMMRAAHVKTPFDGGSEYRDRYFEHPYAKRDMVIKKSAEKIFDAAVFGGTSEYLEQYTTHPIGEKFVKERPPLAKSLPFEGDSQYRDSYVEMPFAKREPFLPKRSELAGGSGDYNTNYRLDYLKYSCPAADLLREHPPKITELPEGRKYLYFDEAVKEWY